MVAVFLAFQLAAITISVLQLVYMKLYYTQENLFIADYRQCAISCIYYAQSNHSV